MKHKNMPKHSPRWRAEITYNPAGGPATTTHMLNEIWELHDIIEEGPNFCAVANINITYVNKDLAAVLAAGEERS